MNQNLFSQDQIRERGIKYMPQIVVDWAQFSEDVTTALTNASRLTRLPLSGDRWEEILVAVFQRMGHTVQWTPGSHAPGADIRLVQDEMPNVDISVKAGSLAKRNTGERILKFSSYRLTRYPTIEDKVRFIDKDADEIAWYLFGAREDKPTGRDYHVYLTKSTIIQAASAEWEVTKGGWVGRQQNGVSLGIVKNMSDQLWVDVPLSLISGPPEQLSARSFGAHMATVSIPKAQIGSRIDLLFSNFLDNITGTEGE